MILYGQKIKYFLFSQYLADGVRITSEILLPVLVFQYLGHLSVGISLASGAFCVSICDIPGPVRDKRNGMLYAIGFMGIMSVLTGLVNDQLIAMGLLIMIASFFFSMIGVFGNRAAAVGSAALLMMIIRMRDEWSFTEDLFETALIMAGGFWYMAIAMLFNQLAPYRPAQRSLGECLHETSAYLKLKSAMYEKAADTDRIYNELLLQQVVVNEKQDITRELLFKNREFTREPSKTGRLLLVTFINTIDLFEQITATWYDYRQLQDRFGKTGLLEDVAVIIRSMSAELDQIGLCIQSNSDYKPAYNWLSDLNQLKSKIDQLEDPGSHLMLKKILVSLRNIGEHTDLITQYFSSKQLNQTHTPTEQVLKRFVAHQEINPTIFLNNFTLRSASFRHALRMMITCMAGYMISGLISAGPHSYWIVLTIIFILKPGFSLTRQRNRERIIGTVAGGLIALGILYFIKDRDMLFMIVILCMIGTYTYQRLNYQVMVIFITPYLLIVLHLLDMGFTELVYERLIDTAIAFVLGYAANHLLFPNWESNQLKQYMSEVMKANIRFIEKLGYLFSGKALEVMEYRLARKELFVSSANLSAAFHRMLSEPKNRQTDTRKVYQFVVLNQILSFNIAGIAQGAIRPEGIQPSKVIYLKLKRTHDMLYDIWQNIDEAADANKKSFIGEPTGISLPADRQLADQLDFIQKIAWDIHKSISANNPSREHQAA